MDVATALTELERRGSEKTRLTYRRHGVLGDQFGVSYADLKLLKKTIKTDQALAETLWASGNHDARILATMIADPKAITREVLESWSRDAVNYVLMDAIAGVMAASPHARSLMERWMASDDEWLGGAGWSIAARLAGTAEISDEEARQFFETIRATIHAGKEPRAALDEHGPHRPRRQEPRMPGRGAGGGEGDRQGRGGSRGHGLQDAGRGGIHSQDGRKPGLIGSVSPSSRQWSM